MTTKVPESAYLRARDSYAGWCTVCKDFTTDCVEPDAENYQCESCNGEMVMGAEQALLLEHITIKEESDEGKNRR